MKHRRALAETEGRLLTREDLYAAIMEGAAERVRPKMMMVVAITAGLLPILWTTGTGSEVMQRVAVPMIGGMVSSPILTLIVIPAVYVWSKEHGCRECALRAQVTEACATASDRGRFTGTLPRSKAKEEDA